LKIRQKSRGIVVPAFFVEIFWGLFGYRLSKPALYLCIEQTPNWQFPIFEMV